MSAPEPLVLLPGMDGTEIMFAPLVAQLPPSLAPHVVTYPATGNNGYGDLLPLVLDAVRSYPRCHVLGWSFSGPLALRAAALEPARVRSVVLAASFVQPPLRWLPWLGPLLVTPAVGAMRFVRRLPIWLLRAPDDPFRRAKAQLWQAVLARTLAARTRAIRGVDARGDLRAVTQPLLYIAGDRDRVVPAHNVAAMRVQRPSLEVATIAGGHFALYTNAPAAAGAIGEFLRRGAAD